MAKPENRQIREPPNPRTALVQYNDKDVDIGIELKLMMEGFSSSNIR